MKKSILFFLLLFISIYAFSQKKDKTVLFGVGAAYNFQTEGFAPELRAKIPVYRKLFLSPRLSYFPGFNQIHELYAGADLGYHLFQYRKLKPYIFAGAYYNNWINSSEFDSNKAKQNNLAPEAGAGILFHFHCFNPFIEGRYDAKWKEGSVVLGLFLKFGECFKGKGSIVKNCPNF